MSRVVKARHETYRRHGLSLHGRAGCDLGFLWAMNTNANALVPWVLFELYRDPVLLEQVREEIAPYVRVVQPANDFGDAVWVPAELESLDLDGLLNKCPLLLAAYMETLRVYTGPLNLRWLAEDVVVDDKSHGQSFVLRKGGYVHVAQEMHQRDPEFFPDPHEWHHERHLKEKVDEAGKKTVVAEMGTMRPFGECVETLLRNKLANCRPQAPDRGYARAGPLRCERLCCTRPSSSPFTTWSRLSGRAGSCPRRTS